MLLPARTVTLHQILRLLTKFMITWHYMSHWHTSSHVHDVRRINNNTLESDPQSCNTQTVQHTLELHFTLDNL